MDVNYLDVDNAQASREATLHLLRLGRNRIATISGPHDQIAGYDRMRGYQMALQDRGKTILPELVAEGDFTEAGGYTAMRRLIPMKPEAVFAASDMTAIGALRALHEANLRVPDDVALIGFDDIPAAAKADPPLTTMRQPIRSMGMVAVETLIDIIAHPRSDTRHIVLTTELVIRASCGTLNPQPEGGDEKRNRVDIAESVSNQSHQ
jgi:LacI family transcriptional regulator